MSGERLSEERLRELEELAMTTRRLPTYGDFDALIAEARRARRLEAALRTIRGPADEYDPYMGAYRAAGGGYVGLQAIARAALAETDQREET